MASATFSGPITSTNGFVATTGGLTVTAGGLTVTAGDLTVTAGDLVMGSTTLTEAELALADGVTAGTSAASKNLSLDAASQLDGVGLVKVVEKEIVTGEVLALNATPITVLAAVGADVYFQFLGAYIFLDYNSAAYASDAGEDLTLQELSGGVPLANTIDGTQFHGTADAVWFLKPLPGVDASTTADVLVLNGGIEATIASGEWITGDSPIKIRAYYRTVTKTELAAISG